MLRRTIVVANDRRRSVATPPRQRIAAPSEIARYRGSLLIRAALRELGATDAECERMGRTIWKSARGEIGVAEAMRIARVLLASAR